MNPLYEHCVAICGQMMSDSLFRTRFKIDPSAFGKFSKLVAYFLECGNNGVLPLKVQEAYPDAFHDVLVAMGNVAFSEEQFEEAVRMVYAEDHSKAPGKSKQKYAKFAERSANLVHKSESNDAFEELSEEQERWVTGETNHFPSPFKQLDQYIDGGLEKKRLYTIGAYSNVGKSKLAYYFAQDAIKQGKKVLFLSLEVERRVVLRNLASAYLKLDQNQIRANGNCHMAIPRHLLRIVDDKYEYSDIVTEVKLWKPDVVVLDFVQNLRNGPGNEYEVMTRNAGGLQQLAKEADCALICLSQTNNDSRFKDGEQATLRGSGALFHSSDMILTLHRNEEDKIVMTIAKNKEGPAMKKFEMDVDFARGQWSVSKELVKGVGGF